MKRELYVVEFDSANYAGAPEHCIVWASSEDEATEAAAEYAEDYYKEQDYDQYVDENGEDEANVASYSSMVSARPIAGTEWEQWVHSPEPGYQTYEVINFE